jgi:murein L,D-transpeptidase YcbB/YkuD
MHGRSYIAVIAAGGLSLVFALLVPAAVAAEEVATAEQPAAPTAASNALPSAASPSAAPTVPSPSVPDAASPTPPAATGQPVPAADLIIASIRSKLADASLRKGADPADLAALDAFYAGRSGPPVWVTPMGFSAKALAVINEIGEADGWGLSASAFQLPPAGALTDSADEQAVAEIKLQLAILKYARYARGGRANPASLSKILDQDPPIRDPKIVLAEISVLSTPDAYLQSLHPKHEQFQNLRKALVKARGGDGAKPASAGDIQRIVINMERWRWMPEDLGKIYVQDNVPEYMLYVVKDGKTIHSDKIVVGLLRYATPVFSADLKTIVFNPEWTVPPTIVRENLLPNLRGGGWFGGSSVLREHGLKVKYNGRIVDPGSINWGSVNMGAVAFVQAPGPTNVLGKLKFLYPNKHMVYMHDTIKRGLFKPAMRAEGHNCIRMERPGMLAEILLAEDQGWDAKKVQDLLAKGYDSAVNLERPVPVHTTYFTASADADGKVTTFGDVYGLDKKIAPVVGKTLPESQQDIDEEVAPKPAAEASARPRKKETTGSIEGLFDTAR